MIQLFVNLMETICKKARKSVSAKEKKLFYVHKIIKTSSWKIKIESNHILVNTSVESSLTIFTCTVVVAAIPPCVSGTVILSFVHATSTFNRHKATYMYYDTKYENVTQQAKPFYVIKGQNM